MRVLLLSDLNSGSQDNIKAIAGGFLIQENDLSIELPESWQVVTEKQPTQEDLKELLFAWKVVKHVKSNAIAITKKLYYSRNWSRANEPCRVC